ncbi:MAG TPA: UDP-N-acetylglucosamine 2-epimerase [Stellaceae bacterium]|nr:UDP-N-acetylglucosamine 2-epimerase [Stellaceae bacterium]
MTGTGRARRRIAVVTVARSDYGIYRPLLRAIAADPELELALIVGAAHLTRTFGETLGEIEADGLAPVARVDCTLAGDSPGSVARSMALATLGFAAAYESLRPHLLVVLGDRYEMHAAAVAAVPFLLPTAHIAGGAVTRGAFDDGLRHSISKLSHLHFPETSQQGERLARLGEEPWRIHVSGSLSIDNLKAIRPLSLAELNSRFGLALTVRPLLVTFHPVTREYRSTAQYADDLMAALADQALPILFTYPNADTAGTQIIERIERFVRANPERAVAVPNLGTEGYFGAMANAAAMVGNSSSGIIEAASFALPVVNIGRRQEGRPAPRNVITCGHAAREIRDAIARALDPRFRAGLAGLVNPYGDGNAAPRIHAVLRTVPLDERLINKAAF